MSVKEIKNGRYRTTLYQFPTRRSEIGRNGREPSPEQIETGICNKKAAE